jgi:hypothetical protein
VVELEAVLLVPGVTQGLTVVPGVPGVVVEVGEVVAGIGEAVCGMGEAVCGVGLAVLPGACVLGAVLLGEVVIAGLEFGVVVVPGFCPAVVPEVLLEPAVPVCPEEACPEGVAVCATSVELCMEAVGPVFEVPQ